MRLDGPKASVVDLLAVLEGSASLAISPNVALPEVDVVLAGIGRDILSKPPPGAVVPFTLTLTVVDHADASGTRPPAETRSSPPGSRFQALA